MDYSFQSAWKIHLVILDWNEKPKKDLIITYFPLLPFHTSKFNNFVSFFLS